MMRIQAMVSPPSCSGSNTGPSTAPESSATMTAARHDSTQRAVDQPWLGTTARQIVAPRSTARVPSSVKTDECEQAGGQRSPGAVSEHFDPPPFAPARVAPSHFPQGGQSELLYIFPRWGKYRRRRG